MSMYFMQSPHLMMRAMMVYLSTRKRVCKKHHSVYDSHHCENYLFAASWKAHSLVECVDDARICSVSKMASQTLVGYSFILVDYCQQLKMLLNVVKVWEFF